MFHEIECIYHTINEPKTLKLDLLCSPEEKLLATVIWLNEHRNKMTSKAIYQCTTQLPATKILFGVDGNKHRNL